MRLSVNRRRNLKGIELIVLDFDGVIIESNDIKDRVFEEIFSRFPEHGADALKWHRQHVSLSRYAKFDYLLERMGRKNDEMFRMELVNEFSRITIDKLMRVLFVKGARNFLETFHNRIPLFLASVTPAEDLEVILEHLGIRPFFQDVYGCPPWTKPAAILDIIQKKNVLPSGVILIGDSYGDQRAAKETGIHFIGRNSGLGFENPQPDVIVQDLDELSTVFGN
jgi:phosphoglycolate phosphatase-like HAD superfamily hydrolase